MRLLDEIGSGGGNGSYLSDPSTADKTWLRVDRPGVQGYFTRKS